MELLFQFHSRSRDKPTAMKSSWCVFFAISLAVCSAASIANGTGNDIEVFVEDDPSWTNFSEPEGSVPFFGFKVTTERTAKEDETVRESQETGNYMVLRSQLDVFYPKKLQMFLQKNSSAISNSCRSSMLTYFKGLKDSEFWALKSKCNLLQKPQ